MSFHILVCVKAALDPTQSLRVDGSPAKVKAESDEAVYFPGPADRAALEAALRFKETNRASVTAFSLGGEECLAALRLCLAAGADHVVHLASTEDRSLDAWTAAQVLAAEIAKRKFDLILCGDASPDECTGAFGPFLGEILCLPQITQVVELTFDPASSRLTALRMLERGDRQRVDCQPPALVTISALAYAPRYVSVQRLEETDPGGIERIDVHPDLPENELKLVEVGPARPRPRRMAAPGAGLSAAQRMNLMMGRGAAIKPGSKDKLFEGSADAAVDRIVQYLQEQGLL